MFTSKRFQPQKEFKAPNVTQGTIKMWVENLRHKLSSRWILSDKNLVYNHSIFLEAARLLSYVF